MNLGSRFNHLSGKKKNTPKENVLFQTFVEHIIKFCQSNFFCFNFFYLLLSAKKLRCSLDLHGLDFKAR